MITGIVGVGNRHHRNPVVDKPREVLGRIQLVAVEDGVVIAVQLSVPTASERSVATDHVRLGMGDQGHDLGSHGVRKCLEDVDQWTVEADFGLPAVGADRQ